MSKDFIDFSKYVATGNDFITLDNRNSIFDTDFLTVLSQKICKRKFSVGSDGLLVLEDSSHADIKMRVFNPDGSEVKMCGNGLRGIALFARDLGICDSTLSIETLAGIMEAEIKGNRVKTQFQSPRNIRLNFKLVLSGKKDITCNYVNTGVPHVVIFKENINNLNIINGGRMIRYHEEFQPHGTNVNFVEIVGEKTVKIRTYERGVEGETLACGTGAVASAVVAALLNFVHSPVKVNTRSRQDLIVFFDKKNSEINKLFMEGEVSLVYRGEVGIMC